MAHPYHHAESSAKKYGGEPHEYLKLHQWLDGSKSHMADFRHRALRHHSEGIFMLEEIFGTTLKLSTGRVLPAGSSVSSTFWKTSAGFPRSKTGWERFSRRVGCWAAVKR